MNKKAQHQIFEIAGWYGAVAIVTAYAMLSFSVLTADSLSYQLLNFTGAAGLIADTFYKKDYQPGVLNIVWLAIALFAILQIIF